MIEEFRICAECGMEEEDWKGDYGRGYYLAGKWCCCQGCAEDTGCICGVPEGRVLGRIPSIDADDEDSLGIF